jgi:hypothetical protein
VLALAAAGAVWHMRQNARSTREDAALSISVF